MSLFHLISILDCKADASASHVPDHALPGNYANKLLLNIPDILALVIILILKYSVAFSEATQVRMSVLEEYVTPTG